MKSQVDTPACRLSSFQGMLVETMRWPRLSKVGRWTEITSANDHIFQFLTNGKHLYAQTKIANEFTSK